MMLSDDEIIIQIIKGNEEALRLLFLYYEKHFRKLDIKTRLIRKNDVSSYDDVKSLMMLNMIKIIKQYNKNKSSFFVFWSLLEYRHIVGLYRSKIENNEHTLVSLEDWQIETFSNDFTLSTIEDYSLHEQYEFQLKKVEDKYGFSCKDIIIYWSHGYSYLEISKICKCDIKKVNYQINKSLEFLRGKKTKKK